MARAGEEFASEFLRARGFSILERNWHFGRGEIDIIARDGEYTVFVEVKTRTNESYGAPEYAITPAKQRQLARVAQGYLYQHADENHPCRFDVITVTFERGEPRINYIANAFMVAS